MEDSNLAEGKREDWGGPLDRLSECISPEEAVQARAVAVDKGQPDYLVTLHRHVSKLLVKYGIASWSQLHASFPEYYGEEASIIEGAADADASSDEDDQWVEVPSAFVDGSNGAGDGKGGEAKWDVVLGERVEAVTSVEKRLPATSTPNSADRAPSDAKSATPCREVRRSPRSRGRSEGEPSKGLKRDSEDECIAGTNKRQKLREGSHLDLPAAESNAPAKSKLKSSSHPGGRSLSPKTGAAAEKHRRPSQTPVSKVASETIPIHAGLGKRMRTARFNWKTNLVVLEDGSEVEPQDFCTMVRRKSPWQETILTDDDVGEKELGRWLVEVCNKCKEPANQDLMLLCDTPDCLSLWHMYCLTPVLESSPEGKWFCPQCQASGCGGDVL